MAVSAALCSLIHYNIHSTENRDRRYILVICFSVAKTMQQSIDSDTVTPTKNGLFHTMKFLSAYIFILKLKNGFYWFQFTTECPIWAIWSAVSFWKFSCKAEVNLMSSIIALCHLSCACLLFTKQYSLISRCSSIQTCVIKLCTNYINKSSWFCYKIQCVCCQRKVSFRSFSFAICQLTFPIHMQ